MEKFTNFQTNQKRTYLVHFNAREAALETIIRCLLERFQQQDSVSNFLCTRRLCSGRTEENIE